VSYVPPFQASDHVLELGGGAAPLYRPNVDVRPGPAVDVVADLSKPPLGFEDGSFDGVFSKFALEHVSWRAVPGLVREAFRILRPGGRAVFIIPNTKAQMKWALERGDEEYDKVAQCIFGDLDYGENSHKAAFSPAFAVRLFREAGFEDVAILPFGELATDMVVEARRASGMGCPAGPPWDPGVQGGGGVLAPVPAIPAALPAVVSSRNHPAPGAPPVSAMGPESWTRKERAAAYDRRYFNGGTGGVGGYAREGYSDFPCHWTTFSKVMELRPESVLELGAARGYVLKRLQDAGVRAEGLEVSRHCLMTRACDGIREWDLTEVPWPFKDKEFDLCHSMATLEHVPERSLGAVLAEAARVSRRGLHGVDFGAHDDGFDKTHTTLRDREWWEAKGRSVEASYEWGFRDKEDLEAGTPPLPKQDGKLKLNCASFTTMFHHGWVNVDALPLQNYATANGFLFEQRDLRQGLPFGAWKADLVFACHFLEHLSYEEGAAFLKRCKASMRPGAIIRLVLPDADLLTRAYAEGRIKAFDEVSDGCAAAPSDAARLWELLFSGHASLYDAATAEAALRGAGFGTVVRQAFRMSLSKQMLAETLDMQPELSLYIEAVA